MTESEKAIRAALASYLDGLEAESSARFIAACNPVVITNLLARLDAAEADAARYRWLRNECGDAEIGVYIYARDPHRTTWAQDAALDAAIDAAIAEQGKK